MSQFIFKLPDVGEGLSEAEIVRWYVGKGDTVKSHDVLVDVQTDKSVVELPSPQSGVVVELGGEEGDVLKVGEVVAIIASDASDGSEAEKQPATDPSIGLPPEPSDGPAEAPTAEVPVSTAKPGRTLAAPTTRKLALELGVDLAEVSGSGPGGRISKEDVEHAAGEGEAATAVGAAAASAPSAPRVALSDEVVPLRGLRRQIAKTMVTAWREVPHITDIRQIDATQLVAAQGQLREHFAAQGVRVTYLALFVKAVAAALAEHPKFNASLDMAEEVIRFRGERNIGIATATDDGLIVPVIHRANELSLVDVARQIDELATAARERRVSVEQTARGTFTITNFGTFGSWIATPIIRPPEAAIAGFGKIQETVVPIDGVPAVRAMLPISISADHRLVDGHELGAFFDTLTAYLSSPVLLAAV